MHTSRLEHIVSNLGEPLRTVTTQVCESILKCWTAPRFNMDYISLTSDDLQVLDTWHALEKDNIHTLLHCICKFALIPHFDKQYMITPEEAKSLLALSDLLNALSSSEQ